jgi:hypothetical protein
MSKKAKEKKSKNQISLDFDQKAINNASNQSNDNSSSRIVYLDSRQHVYKRILERKMK